MKLMKLIAGIVLAACAAAQRARGAADQCGTEEAGGRYRARVRRDDEGARPRGVRQFPVRRGDILHGAGRRCTARRPSPRTGSAFTTSRRRRFRGSRTKSRCWHRARWRSAAGRSTTRAASWSRASARSGARKRRGSGGSCSTAAPRCATARSRSVCYGAAAWPARATGAWPREMQPLEKAAQLIGAGRSQQSQHRFHFAHGHRSRRRAAPPALFQPSRSLASSRSNAPAMSCAARDTSPLIALNWRLRAVRAALPAAHAASRSRQAFCADCSEPSMACRIARR